MRKIILFITCLTISFNSVFSQTNTFPATGNVGIGTLTPGEKLSVGYGVNSDIGIGSATNNKVFLSSFNNSGGISINRSGSAGVFANSSLATASVDLIANNNDSYIRFNTTNINNTLDIERVRIDKDGNVGINTTTPLEKLNVQNGNLLISNSNYNLNSVLGALKICYTYTPNAYAGIAGMSNNGGLDQLDLLFYTAFGTASEKMRIMSYTGYVGIGTSTPQAKLDVNGDIYSNGKIFIGTPDANTATKIAPYSLAVNGSAVFTKAVVKLNSAWPDYVFAPTYKLTPLDSLEQFIKVNGHLPEIPKAETVEKEGIDLGNNQALLLKKIEELTLIVIEQNKRIEKLEKENQLKEKKHLNEK